MHQNTFVTNPDVKKYFLRTWFGGLEMHQNTFLTTPDVKNNFFKDLILVVRKCIKTRFNHSRRWKISFLMTWFWWPGNASKHVFNDSVVKKYLFSGLDSGGLEMHQNTFLTTPDVEKHHYKDLIPVAWKCMKTRLLTTPDIKK